MNNMKYNVDYHNQDAKTLDSQSLSQWRKDYLNGMTAQEWCEYYQQLNQKVIRSFASENNNDCGFPRKLFLK